MSDSIFIRDTSKKWSVTPAMIEAFKKNGFLLVRNMLTPEEVRKLRNAVESGKGVQKYAYGHDNEGLISRMCLWNHPGDDITGILARTPRVAGTMTQLLGGEVYHYHSKLMMKDAHSGGAWAWHQDYGYWYFNGIMYPDMASSFIPVDDCTKENGCLQVLAGSYKFGRIDHVKATGKLLTVDPERLKQQNPPIAPFIKRANTEIARTLRLAQS